MEAQKHPVARLRSDKQECLLFPGQTLRLGRATDNDVVVNDPKVSRSHAVLEWNGSGFTLRDLGSINGTFVNSQRLTETARLLRDGDEIILSKQHLLYEIIRADATAPLDDPSSSLTTEPLDVKGPHLVVSAGPDMGQEFPLWGEAVTIGRASREATWEIRLTDRSVSRPHARIERSEGNFYLVDLDSANGTLLNDALLIEKTLLKEGDVIAVGETQLVFHKI